MISRRLKTWPGLPGEQAQDLELRARQVDGPPRTVTRWRARSIRTAPPRSGALAGDRRAVELAAAKLGAHAAEQLADRERLRHVVVGTDLEPDDLVHLGVLCGQQDDRHRAAAADVATDVEAAAPRHHDVEDQEVELRAPPAAELRVRVVTVDGEDHVEALLLQRVSDRVAHRRLVVGDQDRGRASIMPPGSGPAGDRQPNQNVLPSPTLDRRRSRRPSLDHPPRDREAEPEALLLSASLPL